MSTVITATYENGMLRPEHPLNLEEHKTIRLRLLLDEEADDETTDPVQILVEAGLMRMPPDKDSIPPDPVSEAERRRIAEVLGRVPGKPLSEILIEDRGEW